MGSKRRTARVTGVRRDDHPVGQPARSRNIARVMSMRAVGVKGPFVCASSVRRRRRLYLVVGKSDARRIEYAQQQWQARGATDGRSASSQVSFHVNERSTV